MNKIFSLVLACLMLSASVAQGATLKDTNSAEFDLNKASPGAMAKWRLGTALVKRRLHSLKCTYNFAVHGGAVSTINLDDDQGKDCVIPTGGIIRDVLIDVITPFVGATAVIGLNSEAAGDLKAANTTVGTYTGIIAGIPVGTAATAIKMTANRTVTMTIATAALTAGKANVHIQYQISE